MNDVDTMKQCLELMKSAQELLDREFPRSLAEDSYGVADCAYEDLYSAMESAREFIRIETAFRAGDGGEALQPHPVEVRGRHMKRAVDETIGPVVD